MLSSNFKVSASAGRSQQTSRSRHVPFSGTAVKRAQLVCMATAAEATGETLAAVATAGQRAQRTDRPPRTEPSIRVSVPDEPGSDRKVLGAVLATLRGEAGLAQFEVSSNEKMQRAARILGKATRIIHKEQPGKTVEVLIAKWSNSPGDAATPAQPNNVYRITARLVAQPAGLVVDGPVDFQFEADTSVLEVAAQITAKLESNPAGKGVVLVGGTRGAVAGMVRAVKVVRVNARKNAQKNISTYILDSRTSEDGEDRTFGRAVSFTLLYSDMHRK